MEENLLIVHGGGPTAVINASLYGVIMQARESGRIKKVYGAIGGVKGVLEENFLDFGPFEEEYLKRLLHTPASAIGSSRYPLYEKDYITMVDILRKHRISYVLLNGGNGTMDTCGKLYHASKLYEIKVVGIPKTVDNDIACIDHAPGYGSAARFLQESVREIGEDVKSLPIHVSFIEAMGRNAGWVTASCALARRKKGDAPHLIYLPERPFEEEAFLEDVKRLYEKLGGVVVVVSEGLKTAKKEPIVPPVFKTDRAVYYGDVGSYLAQRVIEKLGIKARSEKPGLLGRACICHQSEVDRREAEWMGREAVKAVLEGESGIMVGIKRKSIAYYEPECIRIPVEQVMLEERTIPDSYITKAGNDVTEEFVHWLKPLVGEMTEDYFDFREKRQ